MSLRSAGAGAATIQAPSQNAATANAAGSNVPSSPTAAPPAGERRAQGVRRGLGEWVLHAPHTFRALVRADELWLVVLAALVGVGAGLCVHLMTIATQASHEILFNLQRGDRVSGTVDVDRIRTVLVPTLGGALVGLAGWAITRWWNRRTVDPIEANALHGGRMSLSDSLLVTLQTVLSNGVGASVGLEAGYTQISSALASRLGRSFRVRRNDLRLLVGCGAAGAIAAAFQAPLTGSFYAFELVIGTYSLATLAPVVVSAIVAVFVTHVLSTDTAGFDIRVPSALEAVDYLPVLALGMICALGGILIMRGVTLVESWFRRSGVPVWLRPVLGGAVVGGLALWSPQVLSSGHEALRLGLDSPYTATHIALLILAKSIASAVSIGSGFRGGLFFASLFLGALTGKLFAAGLATITATQALPPVVCALVGMSAMAVAVVGGPLTMAFLALESTGVSAITVRRTFGYSFATWRFHLRGEAIRSAVDIGWVRNLTVGRMMRRDMRTIRSDTTISAFRRQVPLGSADRVIVLDEAGRYAGVVLTPEAHGTDETVIRLSEILHYAKNVLLPQMTIKEAVQMFESTESDALAVVDGVDTRKVIGLLTEQYALRRYTEELDRLRRDLSGE
jgi:CIC family chloride channel protein